MLLLFTPPESGCMLGRAGRRGGVFITPFHQDAMTHLPGKVCSFFLGISYQTRQFVPAEPKQILLLEVTGE